MTSQKFADAKLPPEAVGWLGSIQVGRCSCCTRDVMLVLVWFFDAR